MIDRLGREGSDGKSIGEDLDGPPRRAVLARSGDASLRGLRCRLHGIPYFFFYKGQLIHTKKDEKGYKVLDYRRKMREISGEPVDRKRKRKGCNQTQLGNSATMRRSHTGYHTSRSGGLRSAALST